MDPKFTTEGWALTPSLDSGRLDTDEPFCRQKFEPSSIIPSIQKFRPSFVGYQTAESCRVWTCHPSAAIVMPFLIIYRKEIAEPEHNIIQCSLFLCRSLSMRQISTAICQVQLQLIWFEAVLDKWDEFSVSEFKQWLSSLFLQAYLYIPVVLMTKFSSICLYKPHF